MGYRVGGPLGSTITGPPAEQKGSLRSPLANDRFTTSYSAGISRSLSLAPGAAGTPNNTRALGGLLGGSGSGNSSGSSLRQAAVRTIQPGRLPSAASLGRSSSDSQLQRQSMSSVGSGASAFSSTRSNAPWATAAMGAATFAVSSMAPGGGKRAGPFASASDKQVDKETRRKTLELLADPDLASIAKDIFHAHDSSGDGKIELSELVGVLKTLHRELDLPTPSETLAESLFKKFDVNNDGSLAFTEFMELFKAMLRRSAFDRSTLLSREFFVNKQVADVWTMFTKKKELGAGTFGKAYLVRSRETGEERVLKAVKKSRASLPLDDIEQEILIMRQVDHPHIVRLFEWYEDSANLYLVLEALKGGTLKDVVLELQGKNKSVKEAWSRKVICQVIEGMAYCHNLRLIHKDLKDENIMLLKKDPDFANPYAVIIDLGVAEMFSVADPQGRSMGGTPMTMAPEVWKGNFGPKCDVWSVGCILYELLGGAYPFMATTLKASAWIRLHKKGPDYGALKSSKQGRDLVKKMLTYKEQDRPTMKECGDHAWFSADARELQAITPQQFAPFAALCHQQQVKRVLLMEVASRIPMDKATEVVELFKSLDLNRDGNLQLDEFVAFFKKMGVDDPKFAERTFDALDVDHDGSLTFTEFMSGALLLFQDKLEDSLHALFKHHDTEGDGVLSPGQAEGFLEAAMQGMTLTGNSAKPKDIINRIVGETQASTITFKDLKDFVMYGGPSTPMSTARSRRSSAASIRR